MHIMILFVYLFYCVLLNQIKVKYPIRDIDWVIPDKSKECCNIKTIVVPTAVVLTKVDEVCAKDGLEIRDIYASRRIQTVVARANQIFGVPVMNIFPVQNYSTENHLEDNIDILLLLAFKGILNMAYDHLEHLEDQKR